MKYVLKFHPFLFENEVLGYNGGVLIALLGTVSNTRLQEDVVVSSFS